MGAAGRDAVIAEFWLMVSMSWGFPLKSVEFISFCLHCFMNRTRVP